MQICTLYALFHRTLEAYRALKLYIVKPCKEQEGFWN